MDTLKELWAMVLAAWEMVRLPAGIAMVLSVFVMQTFKQIKDLPAWGIRVGSFVTTIALFLLYCYTVMIPLRDPVTIGNAILAGVGGPVIIWFLKKYTPFDPDKLFLSPPSDEPPTHI